MNFRIIRSLLWALYALMGALIVIGVYLYFSLASIPSKPDQELAPLEWPQAFNGVDEIDGSVFASTGGPRSPAAPGASDIQYRLAGTFLEYGDPDSNKHRSRKAILDDLQRGGQALVEEGDEYRDLTIARISKDYILVEQGGVQHELWLSFNRPPGTISSESSESSPTGPVVSDMGGSRFGRQVGETRWVFEKQALRDFYAEMMDDPARAVDIYETMRPDYDASENIQGYVVDIVGEQEFFDAVGLRDGDVLRKVNSMDMRSRNRAEYFIKEFMQDRVNALVLDIERDGEAQKLIYLLR